MAARSVFRKHDVKINWPLIIQCSSIGSLGQTPTTWCTSELKQSLGSAKDVQVIYPSKKNVMDSLDGLLGTVHILRGIYIQRVPALRTFWDLRKLCYMKFVLVGLYCGPLLTLIPPLTRT